MCITLVRKLQFFINPKQPFPAIGEREGWRKPVYPANPRRQVKRCHIQNGSRRDPNQSLSAVVTKRVFQPLLHRAPPFEKRLAYEEIMKNNHNVDKSIDLTISIYRRSEIWFVIMYYFYNFYFFFTQSKMPSDSIFFVSFSITLQLVISTSEELAHLAVFFFRDCRIQSATEFINILIQALLCLLNNHIICYYSL